MNTSDVQVYDYVTDQGHRISIVLSASGDLSSDRRVSAAITIDDVERMSTNTHFTCPANIPLGEWFIHGVLSCLCVHMELYGMFQVMNNLMSMANADDPQSLPTDDRHISELTNEQAEWWNEGDNHEFVDYLLTQVRPAAAQALNDYPQLRATKEND